MTLRSFKPTRSKWKAACGGIILTTLFGFGSGVSSCQAQADPGAPVPGAKKKLAYIRFWNMLPEKPTNNLLLLAGEKDSIAGVPPNNCFGGYLPAPAGSYTLIVKRLDDGSPPILRLPSVLPENETITLLATEKNGQAAVEVFNDTPDPKVVEPFGRIVVRQFTPGARVTVSVVGGSSSQPLNNGDTAVLDNIPETAQVNLKLQALMPTTPPSTKSLNLTGDFSVLHHATLLLVADSYGRFRPRLIMDGQTPDKIAGN